MTHITVSCADGAWRFRARGHAAGAPAVCAGVSALLEALAGWLRNGPAGVTCRRCVLAYGEADIVFSGGPEAAAAADLTALGLARIAKAAPGAAAFTVQ